MFSFLFYDTNIHIFLNPSFGNTNAFVIKHLEMFLFGFLIMYESVVWNGSLFPLTAVLYFFFFFQIFF